MVAAVGEGVTTCKTVTGSVLRRVWRLRREMHRPSVELSHQPPGMTYTDGAAMGLTYLTAHFALVERGMFRPGDIVLVTGRQAESGGSGAGCQALGATVIASVSSQDKEAVVREHGADHIVRTDVMTERRFRKQVHEAVGARGVDLIIDSVGGDASNASLRAIACEAVSSWLASLPDASLRSKRIPARKKHLSDRTSVQRLRDREPEKVAWCSSSSSDV